MSDRSVLLVADAGEDVGLGHLARSAAIGSALRARGIPIECIAFEAAAGVRRDSIEFAPETDPERIAGRAAGHSALVLDSYRLPSAWTDRIAGATRLVALHDSGEPPTGAALTVAPSAAESGDPTRLEGLRHACLGTSFWGLPPARPRAKVDRVVVSTGGGDPGGVATDLAAATARALPGAAVALVRGPQARIEAPSGVESIGPVDSMSTVLEAADLVVCGAGGTMLEAAAMGVPAVAIVLAENQRPLAAALERAGAVVVPADRSDDALIGAVVEVADDQERRTALAAAGQRAVDGDGARRVASQIERLIS